MLQCVVETGVNWTMGRVLRVLLRCVEGVGCVDQVGVYDEPRQVLPWGATWAPLEWIPMVGKMVYEVDLGVNL